MKFVIAALIAAFVVVLGLIFVINFMPSAPAAPAVVATAEPTAAPTEAPKETEAPETTEEPQAEEEPQISADEEIYEGALAGLTEEEIGAMAMSEEGAHISDDDLETGVD